MAKESGEEESRALELAADQTISFKEFLDVFAKQKASKSAGPIALTAAFRSFQHRHQFAVGELVKWKPGFKITKRPDYDQPAVVVEVLDSPVFDGTTDAGYISFRQPLDIILGFMDSDGDFVAYYFDSRRFEPYVA